MAGLNLLTTIIIYWNTKHLGQAVAIRRRNGLDCSPDLLAHISPSDGPKGFIECCYNENPLSQLGNAEIG